MLNIDNLVSPKDKILLIAMELGLIGDAYVQYGYDPDSNEVREFDEKNLPIIPTDNTNPNEKNQHSKLPSFKSSTFGDAD